MNCQQKIDVKKSYLSDVIALLLATAPFYGVAQEEGTNSVVSTKDVSSKKIEVISVTAQKHARSINEVGITINAFSGEDLRDLGVVSAVDLANITPGLTVSESSATGVPQYSIRGVGFQDLSTSSSSTVGLYLDGANIPYTVMSRGAIFDIERVEVLKGPQGDLYGRNTTGGQINFISNKPSDSFEAGVIATYSSYQTLDVEGFMTGELTDSAQGRFSFKTTQSNEGWQESLTRSDDTLGKKDLNAFRALINFDINDDTTLLLNSHYLKDNSDNQAAVAFNGVDSGLGSVVNFPHLPLQNYTTDLINLTSTPPWLAAGQDAKKADWSNNYTSTITGETFNIRPERDNTQQGLNAKLTWDIDDFTFTSLTAYDEFERRESNDWDGGAFIDASNINTTDIWAFSQELIIQQSSDDFLWIAGLYYSKDEVKEDYHFFMPDSLFGNASIAFRALPFNLSPILELDTEYKQDSESKAIFGHIQWQFADDWNLTVGARYTDEERIWSGCTRSATDNSLGSFVNTLFGASLAVGDCATINDDPNSADYIFALLGTPNINDAFHNITNTVKTSRWMGKVSIDYNITPEILLYGTVSNGFKSGGFNGNNSNTTSQLKPYSEEKLLAYEIGTKATFFDGSMQFNASTFFYDYRDKQEAETAVTFVGNIDGLTNVPKSEIFGVETTLQWNPIDGLSTQFGVAYLDTEVKEWEAVDAANSAWPTIVTVDVSGQTLPNAPEWSYNAIVSYTWELNSDLYFEVAGDVNFTDKTSGGPNLETATEEYTVGNARVTLSDVDDIWRVQLWVRNVTDTYYYPSAFTGNGPFVRFVGMPRTMGITVEYNFW